MAHLPRQQFRLEILNGGRVVHHRFPVQVGGMQCLRHIRKCMDAGRYGRLAHTLRAQMFRYVVQHDPVALYRRRAYRPCFPPPRQGRQTRRVGTNPVQGNVFIHHLRFDVCQQTYHIGAFLPVFFYAFQTHVGIGNELKDAPVFAEFGQRGVKGQPAHLRGFYRLGHELQHPTIFRYCIHAHLPGLDPVGHIRQGPYIVLHRRFAQGLCSALLRHEQQRRPVTFYGGLAHRGRFQFLRHIVERKIPALHGRITQLFGAHIAGNVSDIFSVDLDGAAAYRLGTPLQRKGHQHIMLSAAPFEQGYIPFFLFCHKVFKLKMPDFGRAMMFV